MSVFIPLFAQSNKNTDRDLESLQNEFLEWKFGMFLHYNMATYAGVEWATGKEDPLIFNPSNLDCEQWADASPGAKPGGRTVPPRVLPARASAARSSSERLRQIDS